MLTTLLPSTTPFKLFARTLPSSPFRATSSSHHLNKKSRAMSLNHGVKTFSANNSVKGVTSGVNRSKILTGVVKHGLKLLLAHILVIPDLIKVRGDVDVSSKEQNVVNWVETSTERTRKKFIASTPSCSPHVPFEGAR